MTFVGPRRCSEWLGCLNPRLAPPEEQDFTSRLRSPAVAARVGLWLGICFGIAFVTAAAIGAARTGQRMPVGVPEVGH
jgi:hypothetical protein